MQKILIIGSAGFLGSSLTRHIITYHKDKYVVAGIDKLNSLLNIHNAYMNKNLFYIVNAEDKEMLNKVFNLENPDIVIYLAGDCCYTQNEQIVNHVKALSNVLEYLTNNENNKKLIYTSLSQVNKNNNLQDTVDLVSELLIKQSVNKHSNLNGIVIHSPQIFGARDKSSTVYKMYKCLAKDSLLSLFNYGKFEQDLLYIEDYCNGITTILENDFKNEYNEFDITNNVCFTEIEMANMINNVVGEYKEKGNISFYNDENRFSITNIKELSSSQLESLNWKPKRKFKENIIYTIRWYNNNSWFFM